MASVSPFRGGRPEPAAVVALDGKESATILISSPPGVRTCGRFSLLQRTAVRLVPDRAAGGRLFALRSSVFLRHSPGRNGTGKANAGHQAASAVHRGGGGAELPACGRT